MAGCHIVTAQRHIRAAKDPKGPVLGLGLTKVLFKARRPLKEVLIVTRAPPYRRKQTEGPMCHRAYQRALLRLAPNLGLHVGPVQ